MTASLHAAFGLAAQALLLAWLVWVLGARLSPHGAGRARQPARRMFAAGAAALALVPLTDGVSAAMAMRALWGDPSVTTLQLLVLSLLNRPIDFGRAQAAALALFGIVFYALALGLGQGLGLGDLDPYRIGFSGGVVVVVLAGIAFSSWWRGQPLWLWLLAVDLAVFAAGVFESTNLWDVLFDPLLVGAALVVALRPAPK